MAGHPALVTPHKGSEMHAVTTAMRTHHNHMGDQAESIAAALAKDLVHPRSNRKGWQATIDFRIGARLVAAKFGYIAALNRAIARQYSAAYVTYQQRIVNAGKQPAHSRGGGFEVDDA